MIKQNQKYFNLISVFFDAAIIFLSIIASWQIRFKIGIIKAENFYLPVSSYIYLSVLIIPLFLFLYFVMNIYKSFRVKSTFLLILSIVKANSAGLLVVILYLFTTKQMDYSRYVLVLFYTISTLLVISEKLIARYSLKYIRAKGKNLKHIVFMGFGNAARDFIKKIDMNRNWGYAVEGIVTEESEIQIAATAEFGCDSSIIDNVKFYSFEQIDTILSNKSIDEVFITLESYQNERMSTIINACEKHGVRAQIIPDFYKYIPAKPYVEEIDGMPVINIRYLPLDNIMNRLIKRGFDIIFSMIAIIMFSPVMAVSAAIIKLTSPGKIIYKQERVGLNRKSFTMYKFRSMREISPGEEKEKWTTEKDSRKTSFGSFIRRTSIDELPQLFNVLKGDMSLIGPRPERPLFVNRFMNEIPRYMVKHQVRPGMTGWAQVNGYRGDTSIQKRIEHDLFYIENWNIMLDIEILWLTLFKGFVNENAY